MKAKYTEKQILCGLRGLFGDLLGIGASFDADTRIDHFLEFNRRWYDNEDIEFTNIFYGLGFYFRFECSREEWEQHFHLALAEYGDEDWERLVAPGFTFGALARFIAERANAISFKPVTIIGRECQPVGVFDGIQQVIKDVNKNTSQFAPSTKIIDVLRGNKLDYFWSQLRWMTEEGVPGLPDFWRKIEVRIYTILICSMIAISPILALLKFNEIYIIKMFAVPLLGLLAASIYKYKSNPLPPELVTFRDLAMLISAHDCDAVRKCEATEH